jgi:hypothetical protein
MKKYACVTHIFNFILSFGKIKSPVHHPEFLDLDLKLVTVWGLEFISFLVSMCLQN